MAFSKNRRLADLISADGTSFVTAAHITDGVVAAADLHSTLDLTGKTVTVATASAGDNDTTVASTAFVSTAVSNLVASAPGTLNTLNELAAALGDDASFSTTVTNSIATKLPLAGGTMTGNLALSSGGTITQTVASDGGVYHSITHTGNESWSWAAQSGSGSDDYLDVGISGGTRAMSWHEDGKVGIGTASPAHPFHITRELAGYQAYFNNDNGSAQGIKVRIKSNDSGNFNMLELVSASTGSDVTAMVVRDDGSVGIGRTDPSQVLEVHKATGGDQTVAKFSAHNYGDTGKTFIEIGTEHGDGSSRIGSFNDSGNKSVLVFDVHSATSGSFLERMRINSTGEVGIGITPVVHYTGYRALDIGTAMSLFSNSGSTNVATMTNNGYLNSSASQWTYKVADEATMYSQVHGEHRFSTAASGSAGAAITWSERMRINSDYVVPKMNFHYANNNIYAVSTTGDEHSSSNGVMILKQQISVSAGSKIIVWYDSGQIHNNNQGGNGSSASNPQIAIYVSSNASAPSRGDANQINGNTDHFLYPIGSMGSARIKMNGMGATGTISTAGTYYIYMYGGSYNSGQFTFNYQNSSGNTRGSSIIWAEIMA